MVATVADFGWVQMEVLLGASRTYASPPADVLGPAVDWPSLSEQSSDPAALAPLAASLHRDPVVTLILQALWVAAEVELLSDDSLREGADTLVRRPGHLAGTAPARPARDVPPLSNDPLCVLADLIDSSQGSRPDVAAMAAAAGMGATRFGWAMQAATGMSPYAFLPHGLMHRAQMELRRGRSVTEVAMRAGYANVSKFSAALRRIPPRSRSVSLIMPGHGLATSKNVTPVVRHGPRLRLSPPKAPSVHR